MVEIDKWLAINANGAVRVREQRPDLKFNELAMKLRIEIPDELFIRPTIDAKLKVEDVPATEFNPEVIVNTKELIEQQTGAKIDMTVVHEYQEVPHED